MGKRSQDKVKKAASRVKKPLKQMKKSVYIIKTTGKKSVEPFKKPETTGMWQRMQALKISKKDECIAAFIKIMRELENHSYALEPGQRDMGSYFVVHESNRQGSIFVHVVPKEAIKIFREMQATMPDSFLGFSVLCGKINGKPVRVGCFAVPTSEITRAMIQKKL